LKIFLPGLQDYGMMIPLIIGGLKALSGPTGCGNIVNWDAANLDELNFLKNVIR
jgi:hypothetical protein